MKDYTKEVDQAAADMVARMMRDKLSKKEAHKVIDDLVSAIETCKIAFEEETLAS